MLRKWLVPIMLFLILSFSLFWGWTGRRELAECQKTNQELMAEIKKEIYQAEEKNYLTEGESLDSPLVLNTLDGQVVYLDKDRVWFLMFINTACPACLETAVEVNEELAWYQKKGLEIISISRDIVEDLNELIKLKQWPIPLLRDASGQTYRLLRIGAEPCFVLIDRGQISFKADASGFGRRQQELEDLIKKSLGV
ncbi:MAG: TlpA family protein disulfide reductase [Candidatus Aminicenantes bacterium]|nr:TlpA family protein disulfide reductase [Candidatus Aminicenantes bacterium]